MFKNLTPQETTFIYLQLIKTFLGLFAVLNQTLPVLISVIILGLALDLFHLAFKS
jgi:hypothetical protein